MNEIVRIASGSTSATIDVKDGGRLTSLSAGGLELLSGVGDGVIEHGSYLMAPWAGRLRFGQLTVAGRTYQLPTPRVAPHAGHGIVLERPWQVERVLDDEVHLSCRFADPWPWSGEATQVIRVHDGGLELEASVNCDEHPFPATLGWHPWFATQLARGGAAELDFTALHLLVRDEVGIPAGELAPVTGTRFDDCFSGVTWPVRVTWPGALTLSIDSDAEYLVIYNERDEAFCVEPQTGPPDGPNAWPTWVRPGEPLVAHSRWTWQALS